MVSEGDSELPKLKYRDFLGRVVGARRAGRTMQRMNLTPEALDRLSKWTEWSLLGWSNAKIARQEGYRWSPGAVGTGLLRYATYAADSRTRPQRLQKHIAFGNFLKSMAADRVAKVTHLSKDGGLPMKTETETVDPEGRVTRRVTTTHEPVDRVLLPWLRLMLDADRYIANLAGLMDGPDDLENIDVIDVSLEGLVSPPARELPEPRDDGAQGAGGAQNGTNGTNGEIKDVEVDFSGSDSAVGTGGGNVDRKWFGRGGVGGKDFGEDGGD